MKNIILLIAVLSLAPIHAQSAKSLTGIWKGSYVCVQGKTGLTLKIKGRSNGKVRGKFMFYPIFKEQHETVKSGVFSFTGTLNATRLIIEHKKWIQKPQGYIMVDLIGDLVDKETFIGEVLTKGCKGFTLKKIK